MSVPRACQLTAPDPVSSVLNTDLTSRLKSSMGQDPIAKPWFGACLSAVFVCQMLFGCARQALLCGAQNIEHSKLQDEVADDRYAKQAPARDQMNSMRADEPHQVK